MTKSENYYFHTMYYWYIPVKCEHFCDNKIRNYKILAV